jgi:hypothetical protein
MNEPRVLRELSREASEQPVPQVDWQRVEHRLFERIESEGVRPSAPRRPAWVPVVAVAAGAAVIAAAASFAVRVQPAPDKPAVEAVQAPAVQHTAQRLATGALDGSSLRAGDRVVADAASIAVQHTGHATWTLAGSSSVVIERNGPVVMLELQSGRVHVDVVPRHDVESFAVRVGETVVSVHGTVFTVERRGERALVQVQRGSVAVGPRSRLGQGASWLVAAPSSGSFSLDGARDGTFEDLGLGPSGQPPVAQEAPLAQAEPGQDLLPQPSPAAREPWEAAPLRAAPPAPRTPGPVAAPEPEPAEQGQAASPAIELPDSLTDALARAQLDSLRARTADCHRRFGTAAGDNVKVTVQSTLTLTVAPDGHVTMGRFDPPLAPEVQACAGSVLLATTFPKARGASTLRLQLRF